MRKWLYVFSLFFFLVAVFSAAVVPINSHDFWWHLKTGEYILQSHELPDLDPFTYTSVSDDPDYPGNPSFFLKQYWLAQLIYASVNNAFGLKGIIVARGLIYVAIALTVLTIVVKSRAARISLIPLVIFCLATRTALEDSDRPQSFSFLFSFLVIAVVEWAVRKKRAWPLFLNIPIMLISSNMHGGYTVGALYLVIYVICSTFEERLRPVRAPLLISSLLALLITYVNPTHWKAVEQIFYMFRPTGAPTTIMEYLSPFKILPYTLSNPGWVGYWMLVLLSVPAAFYYFAGGRYSVGTLLVTALGASLLFMRFVYFFVPLGSAFTTVFLQEVLFRRMKTSVFNETVAISLFLFTILFKPGHPNNLGVKTILREMSYPVAAADFMSRENLPQPVFNEIIWGGYLEWRLWPKYRLFIDTRRLTSRTYTDYLRTMYLPQSVESLKDYGVVTVITPGIDPYTGQIIPLVRNLYRSDDWSLVYRDGEALIFVRKGFFRYEMPRQEVYEEILSEVAYWRRLFPWVTAYEATIEEAMNEINAAK